MRLSKVAKELNVSIDRLAEKLSSKGYEVDARPNSKLTEEQHNFLVEVFEKDQSQKLRSKEVTKRKREEKEALKQSQKQTEKPSEETPVTSPKATEETKEGPKANLDDEFKKLQKEILTEKKEEKPKSSEPTAEIIKAKANLSGIKTVGIIDLDNSKKPETPKAPVKESKTKEAPAKEAPVKEAKTKEAPAKEAPAKEAPKAKATKAKVTEEKPATKPKQPEAKAEDTTSKSSTAKKEVIKAKARAIKGITSVGNINEPGSKSSAGKYASGTEKVEENLKKAIAKKLTAAKKEEPKTEKVIEETTPKATEEKKPEEVIKARAKTLSGPTFTGQKIDLTQFQKPKKKKDKVASSTNPKSTDPKDKNAAAKKKRKRIAKPGEGANKGPRKPGQGGGGVGRPTGGRPGGGGVGRPTGGPGGRRKSFRKGAPRPAEKKEEPTDAEIAKQISETLSRLTGKGKSRSSKYRRSKRDERKEQKAIEAELQDAENKTIKVTEFVTANELATMINVGITEVISSCMLLGIMVTMNQRLDAETLQIVAEEFGYEVEFVSADVQEAIVEEVDREEDLVTRPPIVTIMGHVDHGKTSLLDYIRNANVIAGEAGGITQHIGAYNVELASGKKISFIDTPGHEAFTAMRARGAQVTDIVIIVIAADDEIMPQTKEAIAHAQAANVPIVFAINKVDKSHSNPEKIKEQLAAMNLLVEDWGGKFQSHDVSAKTGLGVDDLMEKVMLEAELLDLKGNPERKATGAVVEASLDKGKGYITNILVQTGTLKVGDFILAGQYFGKVKAMHDERDNLVPTAGPSIPLSILGLNGAPQAGDTFHVMTDEREAKAIASKRMQLQREQTIRTQRQLTLEEIGRRLALGDFQELNIILKGDVDGSIEALSDSLLKLSTEQIQVNIIHKAVGQISDSDVLLASTSEAIIIGFQVRPSNSARRLAENESVDVRLYSIIYNAINEIKEAMEGMLAPKYKEEIVANIEIRETFKISKVGTIAGCMVLEGKINRNSEIRIIREGIVVHEGKLGSLKRFKDDVKEVAKGYECGLNIEKYNDIKAGDIIEAYEQIEVQQKL